MKFPNPVAFRGGVVNYNSAITGTAETLLQSQKSSGDNRIPGFASEIVAVRGVQATDIQFVSAS